MALLFLFVLAISFVSDIAKSYLRHFNHSGVARHANFIGSALFDLFYVRCQRLCLMIL